MDSMMDDLERLSRIFQIRFKRNNLFHFVIVFDFIKAIDKLYLKKIFFFFFIVGIITRIREMDLFFGRGPKMGS